MRKKAVTILLLIISTILAFSGCGSQDSTSGNEVEMNHATGNPANNGTQTNLAGNLTIATLFDNAFLNAAARQFEYLHEGVTVDIVAYDNWQTYAQILNTALMSGGGEDIISTLTLQWQRLADAGRLVNLTDKLDFAPGAFYQSVLDTHIYNTGRYVVPLFFAIPAFQATELLAEDARPSVLTLESLIALSNANPGMALFMTSSGLGASPMSLAYMFFELYFHKYVDLANRTANIDNEHFITLLENIQSIGDNLRPAKLGEDTLFWETTIHSPAMSTNGTEDFSDFILAANADGDSIVNAAGGLALNANSQNQVLAAAFIQFLLSEEMQSSPEVFATPVNRAAAAAISRRTLESVRAWEYYDGSTVDFNLENNLAMFDRFANQLTTAGIADPVIGDFVRSEMTRFFDGEVTAQQAASNLQARITTYLNE